jgi:hypothetical protein
MKFDQERIERELAAYFESPEGKAAFKKAREEFEADIEALNKARQVTDEIAKPQIHDMTLPPSDRAAVAREVTGWDYLGDVARGCIYFAGSNSEWGPDFSLCNHEGRDQVLAMIIWISDKAQAMPESEYELHKELCQELQYFIHTRDTAALEQLVFELMEKP